LARLHGLPDCYRIKWRTAGYRLVHQVNDKVVVVTVVAVGKRDKGLVHRLAASWFEGRQHRGSWLTAEVMTNNIRASRMLAEVHECSFGAASGWRDRQAPHA
jgi:hypothetical protein